MISLKYLLSVWFSRALRAVFKGVPISSISASWDVKKIRSLDLTVWMEIRNARVTRIKKESAADAELLSPREAPLCFTLMAIRVLVFALFP